MLLDCMLARMLRVDSSKDEDASWRMPDVEEDATDMSRRPLATVPAAAPSNEGC